MTTATPLTDNAYPRTWSNFVGNQLAVMELQIAVKAAHRAKRKLDHTLIADGTPGVGKTSLALLTATDMVGEHGRIRVWSGAMTVGEARILLAEMDDGDVIVWDEFHLAVAGGKAKAEWLLNFMQDGVLPGPLGVESQPAVTIIACTTDAGRLPETLLNRFTNRPALSPYTAEEACMIAVELAARILPGDFPLLTRELAEGVSTAAGRNPRTMKHLIAKLRDIALVSDDEVITASHYDLPLALRFLGLTPDGLTATARRYLLALLREFPDGAGMAAMADRLQEPGGLGYTERLLMDKGYIAKTSKGRVLTQAGVRRSRALEAEGAEAAAA